MADELKTTKTNSEIRHRRNSLRKLLATAGLTHLPFLPTSIHLRAEVALLVCNILLICASSHNLYRNAYLSTIGDWKYLIATSVWLGRHVFLRIACTISWVDVAGEVGERNVVDGLGHNRRKDFRVWMDRQRNMRRRRSFLQIVFCWLKWIVGAFSPINVMMKVMSFIKQYGMGGQYCDDSASRGVSSAVILMHGMGGNFGSGGDDHHPSFKSSKQGHHGQNSVYPQNETHTIAILFLARLWGTVFALSSASWALIQSGDVGGVMGWMISFLAAVKPSASSSEHSGNQSAGKKSKKKQHSDPRASSDPDSLDFMNGNFQVIFQMFPDHIRSRALHIQQMRTSKMYITLQKTWEAFPPAQMQIAIIVLLILSCGWLFYIDDNYRMFYDISDEDHTNAGSVLPNFGFQRNSFFDDHHVNGGPLSAYWAGLTQPHVPNVVNADPPSFFNLVFRIVSFGTLASLLMYGRVFLPIPEFVAGTNVLKAVRAEARSLGAGAAGRSSLKQNKDLPWVEQYKSITTENRLRLYYKVGIIRIIENVILCAILPQTEVVCKATEHCEPGTLLWGASGVTGISGSRYMRGAFDALMKDPFTTRTSILVVAFLSAFLLLAQMTVTNRTYMAIMGYICGEWKLVREDPGTERNSFIGKYLTAPPLRRTSNSTIMQWDPKRRYTKGERIVYDFYVYEAMSNSPEGPPFDTYLRAAHDLFNEELGHRSTSSLLSNTSMGCLVLASVLCGSMFFWKSAGWNFLPLLLMTTACAVAGSVTANLCGGCSNVIIDIADEIDSGHSGILN